MKRIITLLLLSTLNVISQNVLNYKALFGGDFAGASLL